MLFILCCRTSEIKEIRSSNAGLDLESRGKSRWNSIHTLANAKISLNELFVLVRKDSLVCSIL